MTAAPRFRRAWITWFSCPRCHHRSLLPRVGAEVTRGQGNVTVLYQCPSCSGLSRRKRQGLAMVRAVGVSVLAFPVIYWVLLHGFSAWTVVWLIGVLAVFRMLNVAADALADDYVPAD